jgi:hypothetical protein
MEEHSALIENAIVRAVRAASTEAPWPIRVVQGGATGVDLIANRIAVRRGWHTTTVPAEWDFCGEGCPVTPHRRQRHNGQEYCPVAGPRRNGVMLYRFPPTIVLAMPASDPESAVPLRDQSKGTWDMIERAIKLGLMVIVSPLYITANGQVPLWPRKGISNAVYG